MATIQSSSEHLTLNADGAGKDIKFQANGVEKASIDSSGNFTSTSIDATKLSGTVPNFTSTGIDDNATSTAITIDANENVGIGTASPSSPNSAGTFLEIEDSVGASLILNDSGQASAYEVIANADKCSLRYGTSDLLVLKNDGRGLSQFTAKAWVKFDGTGITINDSHNISSITDAAVGTYEVNLSNSMGNGTNYSVSGNNMGNINTSAQQCNLMSYYPKTASAFYALARRIDNDGNTFNNVDPDILQAVVFGD